MRKCLWNGDIGMICNVVKNVRLFRVCSQEQFMHPLYGEMILSVDRFH